MTDAKPARHFLILPDGRTPDGALTWASAEQRKRALQRWRRAILATFGDSSRALRVAWVLADLFNVKSGYAFPSDRHLAEETGLRLNKLQETLTALERDGAILRVHRVQADGRTHRHIYPSRKFIPPTVGGGGTPQQPGGQNRSGTPRLRLPRTQLAQALIQARRKEGERP
jgi:hypothetical protein